MHHISTCCRSTEAMWSILNIPVEENNLKTTWDLPVTSGCRFLIILAVLPRLGEALRLRLLMWTCRVIVMTMLMVESWRIYWRPACTLQRTCRRMWWNIPSRETAAAKRQVAGLTVEAIVNKRFTQWAWNCNPPTHNITEQIPSWWYTDLFPAQCCPSYYEK